jgi:S1-C subfamily serine protease
MIRRLFALLLFVTTGVVAFLVMLVWFAPGQRATAERFTLATTSGVAADAVPGLAALQAEFNHVVEHVIPSVVSVRTRTAAAGRPAFPFGQPGRQPPGFEHGGLGSGVIVSAQGHIVTNQHVVANSQAIEVALHDGRSVQAEVVASDASADLAILRINGPELQPLVLGDSDAVRVGDIVLAIGNPFGLEETVTNGIISATGRRILRDAWVDFLQTNAEINPGNSGGPLVNIRGEVIGINTAIAAGRGGGWQGVGFAVPSNAVRVGLESLQRHGRIVRPHLGVLVQELTPELSQELGLEVPVGVVVREALPGGPAARAGISPGDVILSIEGQPIRDAGDLRRQIRHSDVGAQLTVDIIRRGERQTVRAVLAEAPPEARQR